MSLSPEYIHYGIHSTTIGQIVLARTAKGICWLGFMVDRGQNLAFKGNGLERLERHFSGAYLVRDDAGMNAFINQVMDAWEYDRFDMLPLDLRGSDFQIAVWEALMGIPKGQVCAYSDIARKIGRPLAARAVGSAVGENPVSLIVPCHRVVQASGGIGHYGWGVEIKRNLLLEENVSLAA